MRLVPLALALFSLPALAAPQPELLTDALATGQLSAPEFQRLKTSYEHVQLKWQEAAADGEITHRELTPLVRLDGMLEEAAERLTR